MEIPKAILAPIDSLTANPENPRTIRDDRFQKLVRSIIEFPEMLKLRPVVVSPERMILGGNKRWEAAKAAGLREIPIIIAEGLTGEQKREFIIKDNVGFGDWDFEDLQANWDVSLLEDWGIEFPGFDIDSDKFGDNFGLKSGDKDPFQQMAFVLADDQAEFIKSCLAEVDGTIGLEYGNTNANGNKLHQIVREWAGQRK